MNIALITASGCGRRMGNNIPKQYLKVNHKEIIIYTLEKFNSLKEIDYIVLIVNKDYLSYANELIKHYHLEKVKYIIEGSSTRQKSIFNGLKFLSTLSINKNDIICIHDGVRPLVDQEIILHNILECQKFKAIETIIPSQNSLIESVDQKAITNLLNRNRIYLVQTPQTFTFETIYQAHLHAIEKDWFATDDASLVYQNGVKVHLVQGNKLNFKITTPEDIDLFAFFINHLHN